MKVKFAAALVAVMAALGVTAAFGATNNYTVTSKITPAKPGSKKKPVPVAITTRFDVAEAGGLRPDIVTHYEFSYDGIRTNGKYFPTCAAKAINDAGSAASCPKKSLVGTGTSESISGLTTVAGDKTYPCKLKVEEYNAPKNHLAIYLTADASVCSGTAVNYAIDGKYVGGSNGKGRLVYDVPKELVHSVAGISSATITSTTVMKKLVVKKKGKKIGFNESIGGCKSGKRAVKILFRTEGGVTKTAETTTPC